MEGPTPMIDGLPATNNQSMSTSMEVETISAFDDAPPSYRVQLASSLCAEPWQVVKTYDEFKALRKTIINDFGMKVVKTFDFPGDKKEQMMGKVNQATKKTGAAAAEKRAEKRVGELNRWLTLVLSHVPDVSCVDAFLELTMHITGAAPPAPAAAGGGWGEGVPPASATAAADYEYRQPEPAAEATGDAEFMALVVADYDQPSFDGAVAVRADEVVTVLDGSSPDWWFIRRADGAEGAVPSSFLMRDDSGMQGGGFESSGAEFAGAAAAATSAAPLAAPPPAAEERVLMILPNEHVPFAQKLKKAVATLPELEEAVKERLDLSLDFNLWAVASAGGEPQLITSLDNLPKLAKVLVRPATRTVIAVVHNGDLSHRLAMEVADANDVVRSVRQEMNLQQGEEDITVSVRGAGGGAVGAVRIASPNPPADKVSEPVRCVAQLPLTSLEQLEFDADGECHLGVERLRAGGTEEAEAAAAALVEAVAALPQRLTYAAQQDAAEAAAIELRAMLAA